MKNKHKKSKKINVWERWRFKYKLFILNEKTLEEVFRIRLSRFSVFIAFSTTLIVVFFMLSLFILYTPAKHFLPGFSDVSVRSRLTTEVIRVDSLYQQLKFQELQLKIMKNIIEGAVLLDSVPKQNEISPEKWKNLADKISPREQKFIENYEKGENLMPTKKIVEGKKVKRLELFLPPVSVGITDKTNVNNGIVIICKSGQNVLATAAGTVIFTDYSFKNNYTVSVQHNDGFISIYKNMEQLYKTVGQKVSIGEALGTVGEAKQKTAKLFFELWQNGVAINPEAKIAF
ncbi:MAG: M23 family metallopeptidase [Prevotellaceae bacterium]|jgi:murein DD-endopeptidase MepM/ murein hydrolase activator NlpD|nr:M23 family metallopeptidase [Prevotellaceae bacterium]